MEINLNTIYNWFVLIDILYGFSSPNLTRRNPMHRPDARQLYNNKFSPESPPVCGFFFFT